MSTDKCRPVEIEIDGEKITVSVHGDAPMDVEDRKHFAELVRATKRLLERKQPAGGPP